MTGVLAGQRIGFGGASLGGLGQAISYDESQAMLQTAWDAGVRLFDTAPHYGNGSSERRLGDFLRSREGWILSTKVGRILTPDPAPMPEVNGFKSPLPFRQHFDFSYDGIMRSVEDSFQRLGVNHIDILYVHDLGDHSAGTDTAEHRAQFLQGGGVRALENLKANGGVRRVGLGVNTVGICLEMMEKMPLDIILLAGRYTLLDRSAEAELLPICLKKGVEIVIGGVFNSGILATGPVPGACFDYAEAGPEIRKRAACLQSACEAYGISLAAAALNFPFRHAAVAALLIGTGKPKSFLRNRDMLGQEIPEALWAELDCLARGGAVQ